MMKVTLTSRQMDALIEFVDAQLADPHYRVCVKVMPSVLQSLRDKLVQVDNDDKDREAEKLYRIPR